MTRTDLTPEQALAELQAARTALELVEARFVDAAARTNRARSSESYWFARVTDARADLREAERRLAEALHAE